MSRSGYLQSIGNSKRIGASEGKSIINNEDNKSLRVVMTFTDPPDFDLAIAKKIFHISGQSVSSPRKKLSIEDSLIRKSGNSKDLINELL